MLRGCKFSESFVNVVMMQSLAQGKAALLHRRGDMSSRKWGGIFLCCSRAWHLFLLVQLMAHAPARTSALQMDVTS
jgi:hypothetical protein